MTKKCIFCGQKNKDSFNYCSNCGRSLSCVENYVPDHKKSIITFYILTIIFSWGALLVTLLSRFTSNFSYFGVAGIFLPFFLLGSKNSSLKRHGYILLGIAISGFLLTLILMFL